MTPKDAAAAKFWSRVAIPKHRYWRTACWEWEGSVSTDNPRNSGAGGLGGGYGCLRVSGTWWRAHRYIWTLLKGEIPEGTVLGHTCDNRICVNLHHLESISLSENLQQAHDRGRREKEQDECPF